MERSKSPPVAFEVDQVRNADGSITVRPRKVKVMREIGAKQAAKMLGLHVETIYRLCDLGEEGGGLAAWKLPSARGNAKWRIDWQSVTGYQGRRQAEAAGSWDG